MSAVVLHFHGQTQTVVQNGIERGNNTQAKSTDEAKLSTVAQGPLSKEWPNILNDFKSKGKIMLYTNLLNTKAVEMNDMTVGIEFPNGINAFGKTVLEKAENKNEIEKQVSIACGKTMHVKYIDLKQNNEAKAKENTVENVMSNLDIPFDIIE